MLCHHIHLERHERRHGFTLIELSIVLVIIALIIGGIMVGHDLIRAAEIRSAASQLEKYNTAINTFKTKFNCLPGDCINATDFWPLDANCVNGTGSASLTATCNGNGNGYIEYGGTGPYPASTELYLVFQQLSLAGLVGGAFQGMLWGTSYPTLAGTSTSQDLSLFYIDGPLETELMNGLPPVWNISGHHAYNLASGTSAASAAGGQRPVISAAWAQALDQKIDDGKPLTGSVLAPDLYGTVGACMTNATNTYFPTDALNPGGNIYAGDQGCILFIVAQF